ncbi:MAG: thiamine pyrophosphate-dependent enzyme, partial [Chitinophagales bacterium]
MTGFASKVVINNRRVKPLERLSKTNILKDLYWCHLSRLVSHSIRREVLTGKAKFGIGSGGKELLQVAMARAFQQGDFFSGYYRDQTFMLAKKLATPEQLFAMLYADAKNDPFSGGRQMNNHFSTPLVDEKGDWTTHKNQYNVASALSPLAGQ